VGQIARSAGWEKGTGEKGTDLFSFQVPFLPDCKVPSFPAQTVAVKLKRHKRKSPIIADGAFLFLIWSGLRESNPSPAPAMLRKAPALLGCARILHALLRFAPQWFRHFFDRFLVQLRLT